MGSKKKTTQNQTSTNTYGWQQNPGSADIDRLRSQINTAYDTPDSSIPYAFNSQRAQLMDRYDNPFGADYSPEVRDAVRYRGTQDLNQAQGQAYRDDAQYRKQAKVAAFGNLAGMTAPTLTQIGGSMQGTTTQQNPFNVGEAIRSGTQIARLFGV